MKTRGIMHNLEITTSSPCDNRVVFEIWTPIGTFTYDSENYLVAEKAMKAIEQFGISPSDLINNNDVRNIVFDIDISAHIKE